MTHLLRGCLVVLSAVCCQFVGAKEVGLSDLLESLSNNAEVQERAARLAASEAALRSTTLQADPRIRLSLDSDIASSETAARQTELTVEHSFWDWGKSDAAIAAAEAKVGQRKSSVIARQQALRKEVINNFAQGVAEIALLGVYDQSLEELRELSSNMARRVEQRISPETELRVVQSRIRQQQVLARESRSRIRNAELALLQATELTPTQWQLPVCLLEYGERQLVEASLAHSGDLAEQRSRIVELQRNLERIARSQLPEVLGGVGLSTNLNDFESETRAYVRLQYEPDFVGRNAAEYAEAEADLEASFAGEKVLINRIVNEVSDLLNQYKTARDLRPTYQLLAETQDQQLASQNRRFKSGLSTWLDVMSAQDELTRTRAALKQAEVTQCLTTLLLLDLAGKVIPNE